MDGQSSSPPPSLPATTTTTTTTASTTPLPASAGADETMSTISALDLFILTFNCAKNLIDVGVFSSHLHDALLQNASASSAALPELVVFSLQEVAPLSYSFLGGYFLTSYYARFEEALNLAAGKVLTTTITATAATADSAGGSEARAQGGSNGGPELGGGKASSSATSRPYTLVRAKNVGMTAIMLFARTPSAVRRIEEAECGFGAADMGNKGAVALRVLWRDPASAPTEDPARRSETELTFVATHLAAMEWNLRRRNSNWRSIVAGLTFENPKSLLPGEVVATQKQRLGPTRDRTGRRLPRAADEDSDSDSSDDEESPLVRLEGMGNNDNGEDGEGGEEDQPPSRRGTGLEEHAATLQSISIFKPTSHLFLAGDLNYRISSTTPPPLSKFPSFDPASEHYYPTFLGRDQLTRERTARRTLTGLSEAPVAFGPTYKYVVMQDPDGATNEAAVRAGTEDVPWRFASHRWPGWCDRVLYLETPEWVRMRRLQEGGHEEEQEDSDNTKVTVTAYNSLPVVRFSDHRAVFFRARVPVLSPAAMEPPPADELQLITTPAAPPAQEGDGQQQPVQAAIVVHKDPRLALPVPIDVHAWERRATARRRELAAGTSLLLFGTPEGAFTIATTLFVLVGGWWWLGSPS